MLCGSVDAPFGVFQRTRGRNGSCSLATPSCLAWMVIVLLAVPATSLAEDYLNESRTIAGTPQSTTERFNFTLGKDDPYPNFELTIQLSQGRADLRILDPDGRTLETLGAQECDLSFGRSAARRPGHLHARTHHDHSRRPVASAHCRRPDSAQALARAWPGFGRCHDACGGRQRVVLA